MTAFLLLTIEEAAEELRMSPSWVKEQIRLKELAVRKLGTRTRIERSALATFIAKQPSGETVPDSVPTPAIQGQTVDPEPLPQLIEKTASVR